VELILHVPDATLMSNFRAIDRETGFLLPPSIDEWLPEKHLARFCESAATIDRSIDGGTIREIEALRSIGL